MTDIYTEPAHVDLDTLTHLGPLAALAGTWEGEGVDTHPVAGGTEDEPYRERIVFEPIDPQLNGPQLYYGLRYHVHVNKLDERLTFHDQIGYWLWEPATGAVIQTLTIPRAQIAMASGTCARDARLITVRATREAIVSAPFLEQNFTTLSYTTTLTLHDDGTLGYQQDTVLQMPGREPFHHADRATLSKIAPARPNPAVA